jgi:hypothetical protein
VRSSASAARCWPSWAARTTTSAAGQLLAAGRQLHAGDDRPPRRHARSGALSPGTGPTGAGGAVAASDPEAVPDEHRQPRAVHHHQVHPDQIGFRAATDLAGLAPSGFLAPTEWVRLPPGPSVMATAWRRRRDPIRSPAGGSGGPPHGPFDSLICSASVTRADGCIPSPSASASSNS